MKQYLRIGKIISLHGIKGEIKVYPTTDDIKRYDTLKFFYIIDSIDANDTDINSKEVYECINVKYVKNAVVIKIKSIDKVEDANVFIGKNIYVSRNDAVELKPNEYFIVDLIGLSAFCDNKVIGKVLDVVKTKANDNIVILYNNKEIQIPLVDEYIHNIDIKNQILKLKNIEGLI